MLHEEFTCVACLVHLCDKTHSNVCHNASIIVTSPIHMCSMTHSQVSHDWSIHVTWLIHTHRPVLRCHRSHEEARFGMGAPSLACQSRMVSHAHVIIHYSTHESIPYTHIDMYIRTHTCSHMHIYLYTRSLSCLWGPHHWRFIYIHVHIYVYMYLCIYTYTHTYVYMYIYIYMCVYTYICANQN